MEKLNDIEFDWSGENTSFPTEAPPGTSAFAMAGRGTPSHEIDVLMRAAVAAASPAGALVPTADLTTPQVTWAREDAQ